MTGGKRLAATAGGRKKFLRVQGARGVEDIAQPRHHLNVILREHHWHGFHLFHADTVLARDRAAYTDAIFQYLLSGSEGAFGLLAVARIEQDQRMQVAVAGMKDVADL